MVPPSKPRIPSHYLDAALYVTAILPAFPAPVLLEAFAIGGMFGPWLYLGSIAVLIVASMWARKREEKRREWEEGQRDLAAEARETAAEGRHQVTLDTFSQQAEDIRLIKDAVLTQASIGSSVQMAPLMLNLEAFVQQRVAAMIPLPEPPGLPEVHAHATGHIPIGGSGTASVDDFPSVRGVLRSGTVRLSGRLDAKKIVEATEILEQIRENPPTTDEAIAAASEKVSQFLTPLPAVVRVTVPSPVMSGVGNQSLLPAPAIVKVTVNDPVFGGGADQAVKPSTSDSAAPDRTKGEP